MKAEAMLTPAASVDSANENPTGNSASEACLRALERTAPIPEQPERILPRVIGGFAARFGDAPALVSVRASLRTDLLRSRSSYARPSFVHLRLEMELTGTFIYTKTSLIRRGYDPAQSSDPIYFRDRERQAVIRVDPKLYARLQGVEIRL